MVLIVVPKVIESLDPNKPLIFLAGPIRGSGDWQAKMAEELIRQNSDVQIASPCRWDSTHFLSRYFVHPFSQAPNRQLHWERHYMELAGLSSQQRGCVLFWLGLEDRNDPHPGPEPYAMDTRREIGKWTAFLKLSKARVVVGGSPEFFGLGVIQDELDEAAGAPFPFYTEMDKLAAAALQRAG